MVYPFRGIAQAARDSDAGRTRRTIAYVVALVVTAVATAVGLILAGYTLEAPLTVLALALAAAVTERVSVRLSQTLELSISGIPAVFAAVLFGPLAAGIVGAASMLGDPELLSRSSRERAPRLKWATYTSTRFIIGAASGLAAQATHGACAVHVRRALSRQHLSRRSCGSSSMSDSQCLTSAVRGRSPQILRARDTAASSRTTCVRAHRRRCSHSCTSRSHLGRSHSSLRPRLAAQRLYGLYQGERQLAAELSTANETLERANLQFAAALIATLDARDRYTAGHSAAVAIYSRDIAERMGLLGRDAGACVSLRTRSRHREDRTTSWPAREAGCAHSRRAAADAGALGDR